MPRPSLPKTSRNRQPGGTAIDWARHLYHREEEQGAQGGRALSLSPANLSPSSKYHIPSHNDTHTHIYVQPSLSHRLSGAAIVMMMMMIMMMTMIVCG
jgi:hypothetical protein